MRTFLFGLPFDLLRNELLIGTFSEMRDSDEVDDENEGVGDRTGWRRLLGNEFERGVSFTFNFTLNMVSDNFQMLNNPSDIPEKKSILLPPAHDIIVSLRLLLSAR